MNTSNTRVIVCNPGFGNGPYLRCAELALKIIAKNDTQIQIVMPLVYGERQKRILQEEFGNIDVLFDEELGSMINEIAYDGNSYEDFLRKWIDSTDEISNKATGYIQKTYPNVAMEIARSPLLNLGISPSFCTLFGRTSDILAEVKRESEVNIDTKLLTDGARKMRELEDHFTMRFITEPGTFSSVDDADTPIPLTAAAPKSDTEVSEKSIYITVSGIPNLQTLSYLDVPIYSNDPERINGSTKASPHILAHPNIIIHVARAGWGAIWASMLTSTPIVTPPYNPNDDPEIFLNNKRIEELGIGVIYRGESTKDLLNAVTHCKTTTAMHLDKIERRFGTIDGAEYAAEKILATIQL